MNRLFVYGIFLGERQRQVYGMTNPQYATVKDYITIGDQIVEAVKVGKEFHCSLTGLTVDMNPDFWDRLDRLEAGYNREIVKTTNGEEVYMYVGR